MRARAAPTLERLSPLFMFHFTAFINVIKRKLHGALKIWTLFSRVQKNIFYSLAELFRKILPQENEIHDRSTDFRSEKKNSKRKIKAL